MSEAPSDLVTISFTADDYAELVRLVEDRIRSERARVSAYKKLADPVGQSMAIGRKVTLERLRDALQRVRREGGDHA